MGAIIIAKQRRSNVFYSPQFITILLIILFFPAMNLFAEGNQERPDYGVSVHEDGTWQWYLDNSQNNIVSVDIHITVESSTIAALQNFPEQNFLMEKDEVTGDYFLDQSAIRVFAGLQDSDTVLTFWVTVFFDNEQAFDFDADQPIRFLLQDINRFRNAGAQQIANYTIAFFSAFPAEIDIEQVNGEDGSFSQLVQEQSLRQQDDNFYVYYLDVAQHEINSGDKLIYSFHPLENQNRIINFKLEPRTFIYQVGELPSVLFTDQGSQVWYPNPENRIDDFHIKRPNGDSIKGDDVTVAGNDLTVKSGGLVGQLHRGNNNSTKLYYHLGQLGLNRYDGLDITWLYDNNNNDHRFEDANGNQIEGLHPSMSINNHGMIMVAYSKDKVAHIAFGTQDPRDPSKINFDSYIDTESEFGNQGGDGLSISLNDFNDFILIASEQDNDLSYIVGHYDPDEKEVTWGEKNAVVDDEDAVVEGDSYDTGRNVTVSLTNTGRVMEVHRTHTGGSNALYFNRGQLDAGKRVVTWEKNSDSGSFGTPYASGRTPAVALNEQLQASEFHRNNPLGDSTSPYAVDTIGSSIPAAFEVACVLVGSAVGGPLGAIVGGVACLPLSVGTAYLINQITIARDIGFSLGQIPPTQLEAVNGENQLVIMQASIDPVRGSEKQLGVMLNNQDNFCYVRSNGGGGHNAYLNYRCGHFPESRVLAIGTPGITDATFASGYTRSRIDGLYGHGRYALHEIEFVPYVSGRFTVNAQYPDIGREYQVQPGRTYHAFVQAGEEDGSIIDVRFFPDDGVETRDGSDYLSNIVVYPGPVDRPRRSIFPYEWQATEEAGIEGEFKLDLSGLPFNASCEIGVPILSDRVIALSDAEENINLSEPIDSQLYTFPIETDGAGNAGELILDIGGFNRSIESNMGEIKVMNCIS